MSLKTIEMFFLMEKEPICNLQLLISGDCVSYFSKFINPPFGRHKGLLH